MCDESRQGGRPWPITMQTPHTNTEGWESNPESFCSDSDISGFVDVFFTPCKKKTWCFFSLSFWCSYSCPRSLATWQRYSSVREAPRLFLKTEAASFSPAPAGLSSLKNATSTRGMFSSDCDADDTNEAKSDLNPTAAAKQWKNIYLFANINGYTGIRNQLNEWFPARSS